MGMLFQKSHIASPTSIKNKAGNQKRLVAKNAAAMAICPVKKEYTITNGKIKSEAMNTRAIAASQEIFKESFSPA